MYLLHKALVGGPGSTKQNKNPALVYNALLYEMMHSITSSQPLYK
jgi:hypothetical protein